MLLEILQELHPDVDYATHTTLIDDRVIDSYDIIFLVGEIADKLDVEIPADELTPENFNSYAALNALVQRLDENA
ncbi:MAG: acyl carrier protein [Defluviitaleaceae bacterium]|nr:acyl carrier protein [Defluviitaleaceae bacterium]